ncbi:hypothetical protein SISNIDRAFT_442808 [Sistotremastrum niveocremeum HHB9708]|uniref:BTB domain-containing protein n=1 Tax=Sistotremastrum niveocremeum HHB9708 TaxID=1314777 RepID=A0A164SYK7_9AGAM|nr:hypothetical protein SISNIDRAFT_442808 [Sistotremastrum niveocremeum HHB9708]
MDPTQPIATPIPPASHLSYHDGDLTVRTSDKKDFKVHKIVMALASPVFRDMQSLNHATSSTPPQLPIVDISESSKTFDAVLRLIYPVPPPSLTSLNLVADILVVADKYLMTSVLRQLADHLLSRSFEKLDALRAHCFAKRYSFPRLLKATMKEVICIDITKIHPAALPKEANVLTLQDWHKYKIFKEIRFRKITKLFAAFAMTMSSTSQCACVRQQTRQRLNDLIGEPDSEWADEYDSSDNEVFENIQCFVWEEFFKLCREKLKKDLKANVLDDFSLRMEADDLCDCRGIDDEFLRDSSKQMVKLKLDLDALPWSYEEEYAKFQTKNPKSSWHTSLAIQGW